MEETQSIQMEQLIEKSFSPIVASCRGLIAAIIHQAIKDYPWSRSARDFINETNVAFTDCCDLIDINPEWLVKRIKDKALVADHI
jgi:hypothetical protein